MQRKQNKLRFVDRKTPVKDDKNPVKEEILSHHIWGVEICRWDIA